MEQWKEIIGYEGLYEISNYGNARSVDRTITKADGKKVNLKGKPIKMSKPDGRYYILGLSKDGKRSYFLLHRVVAIHFVDNPENKEYVNHKDGDKLNNFSENLEWVTPSENTQHAIATGLKNEESRIANVKKAKTVITPEQKQWIKDNYIMGDKEFGRKALAEKFGVHPQYITIIANSK